MKYRNASDVLPDALLRELQKYAPGEMLYVPSRDARKQWGADSGARAFYQQRNDEIRHKHRHLNADVPTLADEYSLTEETIRKILYK